MNFLKNEELDINPVSFYHGHSNQLIKNYRDTILNPKKLSIIFPKIRFLDAETTFKKKKPG
jgi:hypothetical protein